MFRSKVDRDRLYVDGARVGCPVRGRDVDIEECLACQKLVRVADVDHPYVVCTAWRDEGRLQNSVF